MKGKKAGAISQWHPARRAARLSGLTLHKVNYLCRHKIVEPTGLTSRGRGITRRYSFADVLLLRIIAALLANGVSVEKLRKSLNALSARGKGSREILSKKYVVTDGSDVYFKSDDVLEVLESGQMSFAFVLELGRVRKEVEAKIERTNKSAAR